jgi:hypothetical protein
MRSTPALLPLFALLAGPLHAGQCEEHFQKSGNALSGASFSSHVSVADLGSADALGQMRGILIAEKMDVLSEDVEGGNLLAEQRATATTRAIPTIVTVSDEGGSARVEMTVKMDKGVFAKAENIRGYMCGLLARLKGGDEGRLAGASGAQQQNQDDTTKRDVFLFSRQIANEANKNAVAVNARHKGRSYALKGRIDHIMEDGEDYNVSFEIPEINDMVIKPLPHQAQFRVGVACLFRPNQLTWVLTMREGQSVTFQGSFHRYDSFRKVVWLENCKQLR